MSIHKLIALTGAFIFSLWTVPATAENTPTDLTLARDGIVVPLLSENGGLWVEVRLNDRVTTRMLIDTGASVTVLPGRVAAALDLPDDGRRQTLRTLQGRVSGRMITLDQVGVGPARASAVSAVVLEDRNDDAVGLLGRSFLNHFTFSVDLDRNVLTLSPRLANADVAWRGTSAGEFVDAQLTMLRREHTRALRDRNSSPRYIARIEAAVSQLERRREQLN